MRPRRPCRRVAGRRILRRRRVRRRSLRRTAALSSRELLEEERRRRKAEAFAGCGQEHELQATLVPSPIHPTRPWCDAAAESGPGLEALGAGELAQGRLQRPHRGGPVSVSAVLREELLCPIRKRLPRGSRRKARSLGRGAELCAQALGLRWRRRTARGESIDGGSDGL